jgi:fructose 1,6-bisphosphatase
VEINRNDMLHDVYVSHTGDDIAILMTHGFGPESGDIRKLAWVAIMEMRRQGFIGATMLPMSEPEYTGITRKLDKLEEIRDQGISAGARELTYNRSRKNEYLFPQQRP